MTVISTSRRLFVAVSVVLVAMWAAGCVSLGQPATKPIEAVFPVIERLHVRAFRNQDWCRNIAYARGAFSETDFHSTCDLFDGPYEDFDDVAAADFATVNRAFNDAGVAPDYVNVDFRDDRVVQLEVVLWDGSLIYRSGQWEWETEE